MGRAGDGCLSTGPTFAGADKDDCVEGMVVAGGKSWGSKKH